ncbi:winged helix-turn-helix domain-containing protein [Vibrio nomapromontoriensis]|uniref:winged helix-turn-helix domain-containing protein n=1 Tax=Vibrio nomapromontoriensis TaxID=2910246 RepID=UPI003D1266FA
MRKQTSYIIKVNRNNLEVCFSDASLTSELASVSLTTMEEKLLHRILTSTPSVVSRNELIALLWDDNGCVDRNVNLNQLASTLRKKICKVSGNNDVLETIPRVGYTLNSELIVRTVTQVKWYDFLIVKNTFPYLSIKCEAFILRSFSRVSLNSLVFFALIITSHTVIALNSTVIFDVLGSDQSIIRVVKCSEPEQSGSMTLELEEYNDNPLVICSRV